MSPFARGRSHIHTSHLIWPQSIAADLTEQSLGRAVHDTPLLRRARESRSRFFEQVLPKAMAASSFRAYIAMSPAPSQAASWWVAQFPPEPSPPRNSEGSRLPGILTNADRNSDGSLESEPVANRVGPFNRRAFYYMIRRPEMSGNAPNGGKPTVHIHPGSTPPSLQHGIGPGLRPAALPASALGSARWTGWTCQTG